MPKDPESAPLNRTSVKHVPRFGKGFRLIREIDVPVGGGQGTERVFTFMEFPDGRRQWLGRR
ncbi:MAG: hypothetical protein V4449_01210 [Patescibacteria group bacterium]